MTPHKFDEWEVDLEFHNSAKTSAAHCHVADLRGLFGRHVPWMLDEGLRVIAELRPILKPFSEAMAGKTKQRVCFAKATAFWASGSAAASLRYCS
jgi:hypothetical protein